MHISLLPPHYSLRMVVSIQAIIGDLLTEMWAHRSFLPSLHYISRTLFITMVWNLLSVKCRIKLHKINFFLTLTLIFFLSVTLDCLLVVFHYSC